jgi:hypothetical protein
MYITFIQSVKMVMLMKILYLHSYLFHMSTHSKGSGQKAFEHGLFDVQ